MARSTALAGMRRRSFGWRSVAWILLVAFTLQSFVTETHVHGISAGEHIVVVKTAAQAPGHKPPAKDSAANCPFCQAIVHSGVFFAPSAPLFVTPALWAVRIAPPIIAGTIGIPSTHGWQSRAPPQH